MTSRPETLAPPVVLMLIVGRQDLQPVDPDAPAPARQGLREWSREILASIDTTSSHYHVPIIGQSIDRLTGPRADGTAPRIDLLILFGTNQPDTEATRRFRGDDTIHAARVAERLVRGTHGPAGDGRVREVRTIEVGVPDVHRPDRMYTFFRALLRHDRSVQSLRYGRPHARFWVGQATGTPGLNQGLLLASLDVLGPDHVHPLQADEGPEGAVATDVDTIISRLQIRASASQLLRDGHFGSAATVLDAWPDPRVATVATLARATQQWLDFDLDGAAGLAEGATGHDDHILTDIVRAISADIHRRLDIADDDYRSETRKALWHLRLTDAIGAAELCLTNHRMVDFVARVTMILEASFKWHLCLNLGLDPDKLKSSASVFWTQAAKRLSDNTLARHTSVTVPLMISVAESLAAQGRSNSQDTARIERGIRIGRCLETLRKLRNDSPVAHGFDGVTKDEVVDAVTGAAREYLPDVVPATPDASLVTRLARDLVTAVGFTAVPRGNHFLRIGDDLAEALAVIDLISGTPGGPPAS